MIKQLTPIVFLCLSSLSLFAQQGGKIDNEAITQLLEQYSEEDAPGLAVGIVKDGAVVYEYYAGLANLEHQIPVDETTRFNIASTAKQFTALMVLQLSMEGKLSLEDDIRKYLPTLYPQVREEIKVRHLINHTSGIRDYVFLLEMMEKPYWKQVGMDNGDVIELLEKQTTLMHAPGARYSYSNSGYTILTEIIERVTEESFHDYSKRFFTEQGMLETAFLRRYMGVIPNRATSYSDWGNGLWLATPLVTKFNGDGFLFTTLKDQLIFEQAVQRAAGGGNSLLAQGQQAIPNSELTTYGFGLELDGRLGRAAQYHSGSTFGYHSHTTRFPEERLSVFVMSNKGTIWSGDIADAVATAVLPARETVPTYAREYTSDNFDQEQPQVVGQYVSPAGDLVRITAEGEGLRWRKANWSPLSLNKEAQNTFAMSYDAEIKVRFAPEGMVLFYPSGKSRIYRRSTIPEATVADLEGFVGKYESEALGVSFNIGFSENGQLEVAFSTRRNPMEVEVVNRDELLASSFVLKAERDQFDRVTQLLVTRNSRARDNEFHKVTNLQFQPRIATATGSIQVTTIGAPSGDASDILLTSNYPNGNEIWFKQFGGKSYDKASSIIATDDGYLIIGSTSSYGNGNYDMFVIKTDKDGRKRWQQTYGGFYNEYGYTAEVVESGFLIKGTIQDCTSNSDVFNRECTTNVWVVTIDENGNELASEILGEL